MPAQKKLQYIRPVGPAYMHKWPPNWILGPHHGPTLYTPEKRTCLCRLEPWVPWRKWQCGSQPTVHYSMPLRWSLGLPMKDTTHPAGSFHVRYALLRTRSTRAGDPRLAKTEPPSYTTWSYDGMITGEYFTHSGGGGAQYVCMHPTPEWPPGYNDGSQNGNLLYGVIWYWMRKWRQYCRRQQEPW